MCAREDAASFCSSEMGPASPLLLLTVRLSAGLFLSLHRIVVIDTRSDRPFELKLATFWDGFANPASMCFSSRKFAPEKCYPMRHRLPTVFLLRRIVLLYDSLLFC